MNDTPPTDQTRRQLLSGTALAVAGLSVPALAQAQTTSTTPRANSRSAPKGKTTMSHTVTTKDGTEIFYKDWGPKDAQPIVFHHGWPLSSDDWDTQMVFFLQRG